MTVPFFAYDDNDAKDKLAANTGEFVKDNRQYLEGNHWNLGEGWIGPAPDIADADYPQVMSLIEIAFVSRNVVAELADRHTNGVVGKPARWRWAPRRFLEPGTNPNDTEMEDIALIESWCTEWWDKMETSAVFHQATINALVFSRGPIRLKIPDGYLINRGEVRGIIVPKGDIVAALGYIWPEAPDPEAATVFTDPFSMRDISIVIETDRDGKETVHLGFLDGSAVKPERTVVKSVGTMPSQLDFNLGGRLLVAEIKRPRLITPQIIQAQKALNLALSMVPRTVVMAGFLERVILAGQMPGTYEDIKDASGRVVGKKFIPVPPQFGAGKTNYIAPIAIDEDDGKGGTRTVMTNPDIKWREPSDPKAAVAAKVSHYQDMLEEADQAHILIQSDATPSGNSREQARAEYELSLNKTKPHVDKVGRWFMETLLAFAEELAGVPGKYTNRYRALYESNIDSGPLTPDEKRQNRESANDGYMSAETCMELNGIEDTDAEKARLKAEGAGNVGQMVNRATALKTLADAKFPVSVAVKILGFPEEFHAEIIAEVEKQQQQEQDNKMAEIQAKAASKPAAPSAPA